MTDIRGAEKIADALKSIASAIEHLDHTLFETLGSAKTGEALDGLAYLPDAINNLANAINNKED